MRNDPFAQLGALDQKLFTRPSQPPSARSRAKPPSRSPRRDGDAATEPAPQPSLSDSVPIGGKEGSREVGKEGGREASSERVPTASSPFDLNIKPYRKDSYLFTNEEFEALEDLKIELRRKYDLKATKNDLARCAIGHLLADFQQNRDRSFVVRQLRAKK